MCKITIVDARMGRGKSTAAIRYMNEHKEDERFLYVTPYLNEVDRICENCGFEQPDNEDDARSKSTLLKGYLHSGQNVSITHSLFHYLDEDALALIRSRGYTLIIDESIEVARKVNITRSDLLALTERYVDEMEDGRLIWKDQKYTGVFGEYKKMTNQKMLYRLDSALLVIMDPELLKAFDKIFMLTYMFDGQHQKAYLDSFGFEYTVVGIEEDNDGYYFSDRPDNPPPLDYSALINVCRKKSLNKVGDKRTALSKNWFITRKYGDSEIKALRNGMRSFFRSIKDGSSNTRIWTSFKSERDKLIDEKTGRFGNNYLQVCSRATNEYRDKTDLAYMANRFIDPNISKFFFVKGGYVNNDVFALSEMLQWIWRSAIRDDQPINLYIPSKRMRDLLLKWMEDVSKGGQPIEER